MANIDGPVHDLTKAVQRASLLFCEVFGFWFLLGIERKSSFCQNEQDPHKNAALELS